MPAISYFHVVLGNKNRSEITIAVSIPVDDLASISVVKDLQHRTMMTITPLDSHRVMIEIGIGTPIFEVKAV